MMRRPHIFVLALALLLTACSSPAPSVVTKPVHGITSMAALGDSISVASAACGIQETCLPDSWATGTQVNSIATEIATAEQKSISTHNDAIPGAHMADLVGQAQEAVFQNVGFITILMGANDFCAPNVSNMTPTDTFRTQFSSALAVIHQGLPKAKIYVSSLPNPTYLYQAGMKTPSAQTVWAYTGTCGSLLSNPTDTSSTANANRQQVTKQAQDYDQVLSQVCGSTPNCHYDNGAVTNLTYGSSDISTVDYFHPSIEGQGRLATTAWSTGGLKAFLSQ